MQCAAYLEDLYLAVYTATINAGRVGCDGWDGRDSAINGYGWMGWMDVICVV